VGGMLSTLPNPARDGDRVPGEHGIRRALRY
jgi:hypothetical protein